VFHNAVGCLVRQYESFMRRFCPSLFLPPSILVIRGSLEGSQRCTFTFAGQPMSLFDIENRVFVSSCLESRVSRGLAKSRREDRIKNNSRVPPHRADQPRRARQSPRFSSLLLFTFTVAIVSANSHLIFLQRPANNARRFSL